MTFQNPYPGLRSFEFGESHLFFGRDEQSEELVRRLQRSHFITVVGSSGSGKSSLVRAGLLPFLYTGLMSNTGSRWRVSVMRPGNAPIRALADSLVYLQEFAAEAVGDTKTPFDLPDEEKVKVVETILRRSEVGLLDFVNGNDFAAEENLLIVVDQFEELFRFKEKGGQETAEKCGDDNFDEKAAFVKLLLEATREKDSRIYVVLTMRSDYLGDCAQFRDLPEKINDGQYLIPRLTRDQLREAIVTPAERSRARAKMSPLLVNRLLNDIEGKQDQLPILQHALMRTWDNWKTEQESNAPLSEIALTHYENIGTMEKALSRHANEAYADLANRNQLELLDESGNKIPSPRQKVAEKMFKCLTDTDPRNRETRRETRLGEICAVTQAEFAEVKTVIEVFSQPGRTFLTVSPPDKPLDKESIIDITHESLIRNWEKLGEWVKKEAEDAWQYRRLAEDACLYEKFGDDVEFLWRGRELEDAVNWRDKFEPNPAWAARYLVLNDDEETELAQLKQISPMSENERRGELNENRFAKAMEFLEKSRNNERQRQAKSERMRQLEANARFTKKLIWAAAALLIMFSLATLAGVVAYRQSTVAGLKSEELRSRNYELTVTQNELEKQITDLADTQKKLTEKNAELEDAREILKKNNIKLEDAGEEKDKQKQKADENARQAEVSAKEAQDAKALAEFEKERAVKAEAATVIATGEKIEKLNLNWQALISSENDDYPNAQTNFKNLNNKYNSPCKNAKNDDCNKESRLGRWWSLHNLATISEKEKEFPQAEKYFINALDSLFNDRIINTNDADNIQPAEHAFRLVSYQPQQSNVTVAANFTLPVFLQLARSVVDEPVFQLKSCMPDKFKNNQVSDAHLLQNDANVTKAQFITLRKLARFYISLAKETDYKNDFGKLHECAAEQYKKLLDILKLENNPTYGNKIYKAVVQKDLADTQTVLGENQIKSTHLEEKEAAKTVLQEAGKIAEESLAVLDDHKADLENKPNSKIAKDKIAFEIIKVREILYRTHFALDRYVAAERQATRMLRLQVEVLGPDKALYDLEVANTYSNLASVHQAISKKYAEKYKKKVNDRLKDKSADEQTVKFLNKLLSINYYYEFIEPELLTIEEKKIWDEVSEDMKKSREFFRVSSTFSNISSGIRAINANMNERDIKVFFPSYERLAIAYAANDCARAEKVIRDGYQKILQSRRAEPLKNLILYIETLPKIAYFYEHYLFDHHEAQGYYGEYAEELEKIREQDVFKELSVSKMTTLYSYYERAGLFFLNWNVADQDRRKTNYDRAYEMFDRYSRFLETNKNLIKHSPEEPFAAISKGNAVAAQIRVEILIGQILNYRNEKTEAVKRLKNTLALISEEIERAKLSGDEDEDWDDFKSYEMFVQIRLGELEENWDGKNFDQLKNASLSWRHPTILAGNISGLRKLADSKKGEEAANYYRKAIEAMEYLRNRVRNGGYGDISVYFRSGNPTEKFYENYIGLLESLAKMNEEDVIIITKLQKAKAEAKAKNPEPNKCVDKLTIEDFLKGLSEDSEDF